MPDIVSTDDYESIRRSLGFDGDDTATVPDALIEDRLHLPLVEREVKRRVESWEAIVDDGDPDYDVDRHAQLVDGVVLLTGARLAAVWFARRAGEEVAEERVGPSSVKWRTPIEWGDVAQELARQAAGLLAGVIAWGTARAAVTLAGRSGPTRKAAAAKTYLTPEDWQGLLWPDVIKDRVF